MNMMPVMNILIINHGRRDTRKPMAPFHHVKEFVFEFFRVAVDDSVRVLIEDLHLPLVALAHIVALIRSRLDIVSDTFDSTIGVFEDLSL